MCFSFVSFGKLSNFRALNLFPSTIAAFNGNPMEASGLDSWQSYGGSSLTNTKHKRIANSELLKPFSTLFSRADFQRFYSG